MIEHIDFSVTFSDVIRRKLTTLVEYLHFCQTSYGVVTNAVHQLFPVLLFLGRWLFTISPSSANGDPLGCGGAVLSVEETWSQLEMDMKSV